MAQRDPFSWASEYAQTQHQHASREAQNAQNALMTVFRQEAARQDPWTSLPVDMAKQNAASQQRLSNSMIMEDYKGQKRAAERARVMAAPDKVASIITNAAKAHGLDPDMMMTIAQLESSFDPNAKNPNSTASGLWQFIRGTAKQYGVNNPFDPVESTQGAMRLASDNARALRNAGLPVTAGTLYLAHQQGIGGALKLLKNPNAPAESIVGAAAVRLNGGRPGMSAGQFANLWMNKANSQFDARVGTKRDGVERYRYRSQKTSAAAEKKANKGKLQFGDMVIDMNDLPRDDVEMSTDDTEE